MPAQAGSISSRLRVGNEALPAQHLDAGDQFQGAAGGHGVAEVPLQAADRHLAAEEAAMASASAISPWVVAVAWALM